MIELMLEAERALAVGLLDQAERYYGQVVAGDPRNAIAIVGLARVALERGDQVTVYRLHRPGLPPDPDNPAGSHLAHRMSEQFQIRGEPIPADDVPIGVPIPGVGPSTSAQASAPQAGAPAGAARPRLLDRLRRRRP